MLWFTLLSHYYSMAHSPPVCPSFPTTSEPEEEEEEDPGIIFIYDAKAVHIALGQPGSPVQQGSTQADSLEHFKKYVFDEVIQTPCSPEENCVRKVGDPQYYYEMFHRLKQDLYDKIKRRLYNLFVLTSTWSKQVSRDGPNSLPPHRSLGAMFVIRGGDWVRPSMY